MTSITEVYMTTKESVIQRMIELKLVTSKDDGECYLLEVKIASFDKTGAQLIKEGYADSLLDHLEQVAVGGFA